MTTHVAQIARGTRSAEKLWIDTALIVAACFTWASGLVLFFAFHVHGGCLRGQALGLSRLVWQNIHRFSAVLTLASVVAHALSHPRVLVARFSRSGFRSLLRRDPFELAVYLTVATILLTGFGVWFLVGGSLPVGGPLRLGLIPETRHRWIDIHNLGGILSLYPTIRHVYRRWPALRTLARRAAQ